MTDQALLTNILTELGRIEASIVPRRSPTVGRHVTVQAARQLNRAAGLLAASVLFDSSIEHYRGSFRNPAMFTPLAVSSLSLLTSLHGTTDQRPQSHRARHASYWLAAATGLAGTGFHVYNVLKRPAGMAWQNLFYGAPVGAPFAILLSGLLGSTAEQVRNTSHGEAPRAFGGPAGRMMALVTGLGLFGTTAEAGLLHFRGAFHNPVMFAPVALPPVGGALLLNTALGHARQNRWITRLCMKALTVLGFAGVGFHAYGVQRAMGGWRNWQQNLVDGPPLPAPPSFTALALAGLAALDLLKDHPDA